MRLCLLVLGDSMALVECIFFEANAGRHNHALEAVNLNTLLLLLVVTVMVVVVMLWSFGAFPDVSF